MSAGARGCAEMKIAFVIAGVIGATACASVDRAAQYPAFADARNYSTAFEMQISAHPREDTLLIFPRVYVFSGPLISPPKPGAELIRRVGVEFLGDSGCTLGEIRQMTRPWFEADFTCPDGFDLRAVMRQQRDELRGGAAIARNPEPAPTP